MAEKSELERRVETAHASTCRAAAMLVMMLVKKKLKPAEMREAADQLDEAHKLVQGICDSIRGR